MEKQTWHTSFNTKEFLSKIDLDKLIEKNEVYNESKIEKGSVPCIICSSKEGPGLLLNDKSYLCKTCFSEVATISYPIKYEDAWRNYLNNERILAFSII